MSSSNDDLRNRPSVPVGAGYGTAGGNVMVAQTTTTALDRVRWGPIWAGIFTSVSVLFLLSLLGIAVGLSAYDATENARGFGIGAGIWQMLSVVLAFLAGGWVAGKTSDWNARRTGWLNGALVWAVAIPLILLLLTSGVSGIAGMAGNMAAQILPQQQRQQYQARGTAGQDNMAQQASAQLQQAGESVRGAVTGERPPDESTVNRAQAVAWWTFGSFAIGLLAAGLGGYLGAKSLRRTDEDRYAPAAA